MHNTFTLACLLNIPAQDYFFLRLLDNGFSGKDQYCCVGHVTMTNSA